MERSSRKQLCSPDLQSLYAKYLPRKESIMNAQDVAKELKASINGGKVNEVKTLLEPFISPKEIQEIEDKFCSLCEVDPINYAIDCKKEKVAIYLVEKAFSLTNKYWENKAVCDEWCFKNHDPGLCPHQYDCCSNAKKHNMELLMLRLDGIKQGKSRPGEGLSDPIIEKHMPHLAPPRQQRPVVDKNTENVRLVSEKKEKSHADDAREIVLKYGVRHSSKYGGTLLHMNVDKPRVVTYILANHGVPVNVQDVNGDTALHLAVRKARLDIVEALVQCSADLTLRNKMGQTPVEEAEGPVKSFLRTFEPGILKAVRLTDTRLLFRYTRYWCNVATNCKPGVIWSVRCSHYNNVLRVYKRSWCNVHTKVKEGKSLLEWTGERAEAMSMGEVKTSHKSELKKETDAAKNSFRVLSEYKPTSELIHAVLCEDVELTRNVLREYKDLKVNVRFRDRIGKTLLSHAIEANNYDLVKLLVDNGAHVAQIRVRENEQTDITVPLYQKALRGDIDVNIVKLLQTVLPDSCEHEEKDMNGNTPLLRAIEDGVGSQTIHWLIKSRGGYSLLDRNKDGFNPREIAQKRDRTNVVEVIDRFISKEVPPIVLRLFPVSFYSGKLLNIEDESGEMEQKLNKAAESHHVKTWIDVNETQNKAQCLFEAAATGDIDKINKLNDANYQDKNGYTALIRAIVFNQLEAANKLCITRPALRRMPDNCNRYPLHYAYAMPEDQGRPFIRLILDKDACEIENRVDKDGRVAAEYKSLRCDKEITQMLYDARTLDVFGKRGAPLGRWPKGADTIPPNLEEEDTMIQYTSS